MSKELVLLPEQRLLLAVADYFDEGHFCQDEASQVDRHGMVRRCTISAIDMLGQKLPPRIRILAKHALADYLVKIDDGTEGACWTALFTNGKIDADETIINWHDMGFRTAKEASATIRAAVGVLPVSHTPTPKSLPMSVK